MEIRRSGFSVLRRLALTVVPLLAVAFGSVAAFGDSTAEAAVGAGLGVSCSVSSSNGVTTVKLNYKIKAFASSGETISNVTLDIAEIGVGPEHVATPGTTFYQFKFVTGPVTTGTYHATLTVTGSLGGTATATSTATVTISAFGASCRHQSPSP